MERKLGRPRKGEERADSPFGILLKQYLYRRTITQDTFAEQMGVDTKVINDMIKGGKWLEGTGLRQRLLDILKALKELKVLSNVEEANRLLEAAGSAELDSDQPEEAKIISLLKSPTNLYSPLTSLIGRREEISEAKRRLAHSRLLTLTGAGGAGKTRLALQVAHELLGEFSHGVYFVALSALTDSAAVASTIAHILRFQEIGTQNLTERLKSHLADKQMLLVLDNFEHLMSAASLVEELLRAAPRLKILVTSRTVLRLSGEQRLSVLPLALPDFMHLSSVETALEYPAVNLFVERAQAIEPNFSATMTLETVKAIAEICTRLDGLPLAIELAAACLNLFSVEDLRARLTKLAPLPSQGVSDLPLHQQTLRNTIEWSYNLLNEDEKELFPQLTVFRGGFNLTALEAIGQVEGRTPAQVLISFESLVDKSLVRRIKNAKGELRFNLLDTIRQYAQDKLEAKGITNELQNRHLAFFLAFAQEAESHSTSTDQFDWLSRIETEYANLRIALNWAFSQGKTEEGLQLAGALSWFWYIRGYFTEGIGWLKQFLDQPGLFSKKTWAKALLGFARLLARRGDYSQAWRICQKSQLIYQELEDYNNQALLLSICGNIARYQGDLTQALELHQQGLELRRKIKDRWGIAVNLNNLGGIAWQQGRYVEAAKYYSESLEIRRELHDTAGIAESLSCLGWVAWLQAQIEKAEYYWENSLKLRREINDKSGIATAVNGLGYVAQWKKDYERAADLYQQSLVLRREMNDSWGLGYALLSLGALASHQQDYATAEVHLREGLAVWWQVGRNEGVTRCLEELAGVALGRQELSEAARLLGAAEALRAELALPIAPVYRPAYDSLVEGVRKELSLDDPAWKEGQEGEVSEIIRSVLTSPTRLSHLELNVLV